MIDEKIKVSSRASFINASRTAMLRCVKPISSNRKNRRLSFASFRQIFARIRKSFLLKASSASNQFAATEPEARTNSRTSSMLASLRGSCFTNPRTAWGKLERPIRPDRVASPPWLEFDYWDLDLQSTLLALCLELGSCNLGICGMAALGFGISVA